MDTKAFIDGYAPIKDTDPGIFKKILETGKTLALTEDEAPKVVVMPYETFTYLINGIDMVADNGPLRRLVQSVRHIEKK